MAVPVDRCPGYRAATGTTGEAATGEVRGDLWRRPLSGRQGRRNHRLRPQAGKRALPSARGGSQGAAAAPRGAVMEGARRHCGGRSEEHTSELQSLMRISYAVFCLKKKNTNESTHRQ